MKKVSVWMITYNHEKYIEKAIESVLAQKVDFDWEIVISDDASTDKTPKIIERYAKKYPKIIRAYLHKKNKGMMWNMRFTLEKCRGEYIALCEGDDYWTDKNKLKKQIIFLDNNLEYSLAGHNVWILNQNTKMKSAVWSNQINSDFTLEDGMRFGCGAATCSLMFRRESVKILPKWFDKCRSGDWPLHLISLQHGKMYRDNKKMAVYRKHDTGSLYAAVKNEKKSGNNFIGIQYKYTIETINLIDDVFGHVYSNLLSRQKVYANLKLAELSLLGHDFKSAKEYWLCACNYPRWLFENMADGKLFYLFSLLLPTELLILITKLRKI